MLYFKKTLILRETFKYSDKGVDKFIYIYVCIYVYMYIF